MKFHVGQVVRCKAKFSLIGREINCDIPYEVERINDQGRAFIYHGYVGYNVNTDDLEPWEITAEDKLGEQLDKLSKRFNILKKEHRFHAAKAAEMGKEADAVGAEIAELFKVQIMLASMTKPQRALYDLEKLAEAEGRFTLRYIEDKGTTVALIEDEQVVVARGVARRAIDDKFDRTTGRTVALRKALGHKFDVTQYGESYDKTLEDILEKRIEYLGGLFL